MTFPRRLALTLIAAFAVGATWGSAQSAIVAPDFPPPPPSPVNLPPVVVSGIPSSVNPPQLYGISGGGAVEFGQRVALAVMQPNSSEVFSYAWQKGDTVIVGATQPTYVIAAAGPSDTATYTITVSNAAGASVASTDVTVKDAAPPVITRSPAALVRQVGQEAVFGYAATGSYPRTHQWRKNGVAIAGADGETYTLRSVKTTDAGTYSVVVTNNLGSATTQAAALTVNAATLPVIQAGYPADQTVTAGAVVRLYAYLIAGSEPFTYQWYKDGAAVAGATAAQLEFDPVAQTDAGKYSVEVTNAAGSATSRQATLTVNPPTPITISRQPESAMVYEGQAVSFGVSVSGSSPYHFQWQKNGVAIAGATNSYFNLNEALAADAGNYSVRISNAAGEVTSAIAILTVNPAIKPSITQQPQGSTVLYGENINLYVQVAGTQPLRIQWRKDGVDISGATSSSYSVWSAKPAHSGSYTVVISNRAGSVTSTPASVTVQPAVVPTITKQPVSREVALGLSASFDVSVSAQGAGEVRFQWRKDGVALPGATSNMFYLQSATAADEGDYTVVVTGDGGAVTSAVVRLTVLPPAPPSIRYGSFYERTVVLGGSESLSVSSVEGSPPFAYQWSRDGVPIPGATSPTLNLRNVTAAMLGVYTLTITNEGGVFTTPPMRLRLSVYASDNPTPWMDVGRINDVVYFLATSPSRIERYDLAAERWLPTVILSETLVPTAFAPASDGVYLAYGRTLVRRSLDLSIETSITNVAEAIKHLFVFDDWLYYGASGSDSYAKLRRSTLALDGVAGSGYLGSIYNDVAFAPSLRKIFARDRGYSPADLNAITIAADGTFAEVRDSPYHGDFPAAARTYVFANEQRLADNAGVIYRTSDMTYAGSLGESFTDLAFLSDGTPVILRGLSLDIVATDTFFETGRVMLSRPGTRVFTRGTNAFVFGAAETAGISVSKVSKSQFAAPLPSGSTLPPTGRFSVDEAFLSPDGVVYVFSRSLQAFVRWSVATRTFLPSVPLRSAPQLVFHQPGGNRALLAYPDGQITAVALGKESTALEQQIGAISNRPFALLDLGDSIMTNVYEGQVSADLRLVLGPRGDVRYLSGWSYYGGVLAWQAETNRVYSQSQYSSSNGLQFETLTAERQISTVAGSTGSAGNAQPPLRFNPEGTLLATGNGKVLNADLAQVGVLANDILDAAWLDTGLYTLRAAKGATEIQQWSRVSYLLSRSVPLPGTPVRLFRVGDGQLLAISATRGAPVFTLLNADLSISGSNGPSLFVATQPVSQAVAPTGSITLTARHVGGIGDVTYQWMRDGAALAGATGASLALTNVAPSDTGLYVARIADTTTSTSTEPAIISLSLSAKVAGEGREVAADIRHPSGRIFDQILLEGAAASLTADSGQVTRLSYLDLDDDIVQVEFSGAGTLSLVLSAASGPADPVKYVQPGVRYMKGHAGIVVSGANETTHLSVFSVGRANAVNPNLFPADMTYDGLANIAYIAIESSNGKFGGLRCANTCFFGSRGWTGVYAPGVHFTGPVYVGELTAYDDATPVLVIGSTDGETLITGGALAQANGRAVRVTGLTSLKFVDGTGSDGRLLPAQRNQARLEQGGIDLTDQIVVNPTP